LRTWQSQASRAGRTSRRGLLFFTSAAFEAGLCLPFPSQRLYLGRDEGLSAERAREVAEEVQRWRDSGEIFLPSFPAERIAAIENTLAYPEEGSPEHRAIASRYDAATSVGFSSWGMLQEERGIRGSRCHASFGDSASTPAFS
jgi:hypothetical protein